MVIKIDKEKCIGCGLCASTCSEVFELKDDMKAYVKKQKNLPCVIEAIESCPVEAISN
ncbi:MAG: ferredoxin [Nanoarchaeota archaeon]